MINDRVDFGLFSINFDVYFLMDFSTCALTKVIIKDMDSERRRLRRGQLDRQLLPYRAVEPPLPPRGGWLKSIREAYGMTLGQLGARLGVTGQAVHRIELSESRGTLSLSRLRKVADSLGCEVVVLVVPRKSLEATLEDRAAQVARSTVSEVNHSMALEAQDVKGEMVELLQRTAARSMIEANDRRLWEP